MLTRARTIGAFLILLGSLPALAQDVLPPQFAPGSFLVTSSSGGFRVAGSTTDTASPVLEAQVQDTGSGLRTGVVPSAVSSATALLLRFDEGSGTSAADASGNNPAATLYGASWGAGRFGSAAVFDGTASSGTVPDGPALDLAGPLTLEAWVNVASFATSIQEGMCKANASTSSGYIFPRWENFNHLAFYLHIQGSWVILDAGNVVSPGVWTHVAATYDGAAMRIYVNGVEAAEQAQTGAVDVNSNPLALGAQPGIGEFLNGSLDEARILNRALTADEIATDYNSGIVKVSTSGPSGPWTYVLNPAVTGVTGAPGTTAVQTATAAVSLVQGADNRAFFLAQDEAGNLGASPVLFVGVDSTTPAAVGDLSASPVLPAGSLARAFSAPFDQPAPLMGSYAVEASTDPAVSFSTAAAQVLVSTSSVSAGSAQSIALTSLTPNTTYYLGLWTIDQGLNVSPLSNAAAALTLAAAPPALTATALSSQAVSLDWSGSGNPAATPYELTMSTDGFASNVSTPIAFAAGYAASTASLAGLSPGTAYTFRVRARNAALVPTAYASLSTTTPVVAVLGLSTSSVQATSLTWTWLANEGPAAVYDVYSAATGQLLAQTTAAFYAPSGLSPDTAYGIFVGASDAYGAGPLTSAVTAYTLAAAPASLAVTINAPVSLSLAWSASGNPASTPYELTLSTDGFLQSVSTPIAFAAGYTASTASIGGLLPGTSYFVRVRAVNGDGVSTAYASASTETLPAVITGLSVSTRTTTALQWTWINTAGPGVTSYLVFRAASGALLAAASTTTFADAGLSTSTAYGVSVQAVDDSGPGLLSPSATGYTLAAPPGLPVLTAASSTSASLEWYPDQDPPGTPWEVQLSTDGFVSSLINPITFFSNYVSTFATVSSLAPGTTYQARVRGRNGDPVLTPTAYSPARTFVTLPGAVSALAGTGISFDAVQWSWTSAQPAVYSFRVYDGVSGQLLAQTTAPAWLEAGLSTNSAVSVMVTAVDASGEGPLSAASTGFSLAAPPLGLTPVSASSTSILAAWSANQNPAGTVYELSVSTDGFAASISTPVPFGAGLILAQASAAGLPAGTTVYLRVRAENGLGQTTAFAAASTETLPGLVAGLSGSALGVSSLSWTWSASAGPAVMFYNVYRAGSGLFLGSTAAPSFLDASLSTNAAYGLQVEAVDAAGAGAASPAASATTWAAPPLPGPTSALSEGAVQTSWSPGTDPPGTIFEAQLSASPSFSGAVYDAGLSTAAAAVFTSLAPGTTYYARVRAQSGGGVPTAFTSLPSAVTPDVRGDAAAPVFSTASFRVLDALGLPLSPGSTTNAASPGVQITVQDAGPSGLRLGAAELAVTSATALMLRFNSGQGATAFDSSGNGLDASTGGAAWGPGEFGSALVFSGSTVPAQVPYSPLLDFTSAFTVEAWVNAATVAPTMSAVSKASAANDTAYTFPWFSGGHLFLRVNIGGLKFLDAGPFAAGSWTHVAATYDGFTLKVYKGGRLAASAAQAGLVTTNPNPLTLGDRPGAGEPFFGSLDEVRLLSRALSADEIATDVLSGAVKYSTGGASAYDLAASSFSTSGVSGSTSPETISIQGLPLVQDGSNGVAVLVQDLAGNVASSPFFQVVMDSTPPSAVSNLAVSTLSDTAAALTWTSPADDPEPLQGSYLVELATGAMALSPALAQLSAATATAAGLAQTLSLSALQPNTTYAAELWSKDQARNVSGPSNAVSFTTLAPAVTGAALSAVYATSAAVSWTPLSFSTPAIPTTEFLLEASTAADFSAGILSASTSNPSAASLTVVDLRPSSTYFFRVSTLNWPGARNTAAAGSGLTAPTILAVSLSTGAADAGLLAAGQIEILSVGVTVQNAGNVRETFSLQAETVTASSPWAVASSSGADRLQVWAAFNPFGPSPGSFVSADLALGAPAFSDPSRFSLGITSGARVSSGDSRTLWVQVQAPLPTSTTAQQTIELDLTASDADALPPGPPAPSTGPATARLFVTITPSADFGIAIASPSLSISLAPGTTGFLLSPTTVTVLGTAQPVELNLSGSVQASTAPWSLSADETIGTDVMRWYALFSSTGAASAPAGSYFQGTPRLVTTAAGRAGGVNGLGTGYENPAMPGGASMDNLTPGAQRWLWFRLDAPSDSSATVPQTLQLTLTATRSGL